jgi:hypothetical protein
MGCESLTTIVFDAVVLTIHDVTIAVALTDHAPKVRNSDPLSASHVQASCPDHRFGVASAP